MTHTLLTQHTWRIIDDTSLLHQSALHSFASDDALCTTIGDGTFPSTARFWVHSPTIVLGIQDTRLPFLEEGISFLREEGYDSVVRNSGGLAVVLDDGILNLSLLLKEAHGSISITSGYEAMYTCIRSAFSSFPVTIDAYEIKGSYCPGSYDLSINGKKFAGISQRRVRNGVAVQIYLCVTPSGAERAKIIRNFYQLAQDKHHVSYSVPDIQPHVMASLTELVGFPLSVSDVQLLLLQTLKKHATDFFQTSFSLEEQKWKEHYLTRLLKRNEQLTSYL